LANLHFAPTDVNRANLIGEGIDESTIFVTGNPVIDALLQVLARIESTGDDGIGTRSRSSSSETEPSTILITAHRRESFGEPLRSVCRAIGRLAIEFPQYRFVFSVHPNPNVVGTVEELLGSTTGSNLRLVEPMSYPAFVELMASATLILSDSGGVQEEAPSLGVPVLLLRECTERPEGVDAGATKIVGTDERRILEAFHELIPIGPKYLEMAKTRNPYGDGLASERIVGICLNFLA
jgi:UDP-N-acetylglucosamine 2-epimerase (non-hydrolysing)